MSRARLPVVYTVFADANCVGFFVDPDVEMFDGQKEAVPADGFSGARYQYGLDTHVLWLASRKHQTRGTLHRSLDDCLKKMAIDHVAAQAFGGAR